MEDNSKKFTTKETKVNGVILNEIKMCKFKLKIRTKFNINIIYDKVDITSETDVCELK